VSSNTIKYTPRTSHFKIYLPQTDYVRGSLRCTEKNAWCEAPVRLWPRKRIWTVRRIFMKFGTNVLYKKKLASKRCVSSKLAQWRSYFTLWRKWISTHTGTFISRFWWYFHVPSITVYGIRENRRKKSQYWLSTPGIKISCPHFPNLLADFVGIRYKTSTHNAVHVTWKLVP
jgi:hypothetical protein